MIENILIVLKNYLQEIFGNLSILVKYGLAHSRIYTRYVYELLCVFQVFSPDIVFRFL